MDLQKKMDFYNRFLIINHKLRQYVLPFPVVFLIFLSISLTIPKKNKSLKIRYIHKPTLLDSKIKKFSSNEKINSPILTLKPTESPKINSKSTNSIPNQIVNSVSKIHRYYFEKNKYPFFNESLRRIVITFLQFESISRKRFNRGTESLPTQVNLEDLANHIVESRWYRETLRRFSANKAYGFSEERMLRILFSIQVSAHFFNVPYPALFCLFFQESKFNFLANSHTGAKGIGQLTSIAIKEIQRLRKNPKNELLLQKAANHLNQVYTDPHINMWLNNLGFNVNLPKIYEIPKNIEFTKINSSFMQKVGKELVKNGQLYGNNISLLWYLSKKVRRGRILSNRYAHMHKVFSQILENEFAMSQSSAYNIETNIIYSTLLFNNYYRYKWKKNKEIFDLSKDARALVAVAAYNHGQSGMRRFLINLRKEFPTLEYKSLSVKKFEDLFTIGRISKALQRPFYKIRETSKHVQNIIECSIKKPTVL